MEQKEDAMDIKVISAMVEKPLEATINYNSSDMQPLIAALYAVKALIDGDDLTATTELAEAVLRQKFDEVGTPTGVFWGNLDEEVVSFHGVVVEGNMVCATVIGLGDSAENNIAIQVEL